MIFAHSLRERSAKVVQREGRIPNPIDKHVGSRVRMRRKMLAMSQEQLADALGLSFQQVQKNENGTNRIGASRLQAGCAVRTITAPRTFPVASAIWAADPSTGIHQSRFTRQYHRQSSSSKCGSHRAGIHLTNATCSRFLCYP